MKTTRARFEGNIRRSCVRRNARFRVIPPHSGECGYAFETRSGISAIAGLILISTLSLAEDNQPAPRFSAEPIWSSGSSHSGGDGNARWIDADKDGDLDLVTSAPNPRRWVLFKNQGGKLTSKPAWQSEETTDCDHISVLDFNQDGWEDLGATHESHCTLYLNRARTEKAAFSNRPNWETGLFIDANQIDFGDFDKDGDLDMLMASGLPVFSLALFENREGTPSTTVSRTIGLREYSETAIFADFDSDGDLDIVVAYSKQGTVVVYDNDGGQFDDGTLVYDDQSVPWCQRIYCIDIDQDGDKELFCAKGPWGPPGASVALDQQADSKTMKVIWKSASQTGFHGFDFRDVDRDGDLDMVAADWGGRSVSLYLQEQGAISNSPAWSAKTTGPAHEAVLGDVDGDGDLDLAVGCLDQALVFENLLIQSE
jgi:hypothetical protein